MSPRRSAWKSLHVLRELQSTSREELSALIWMNNWFVEEHCNFMAQVFISYSHKDNDYAHRLVSELSKRGIDAWIDDRINYGGNWPRVIQESMDSCSVVIIIMSSNAYYSNWVQNELSYAQSKGKNIFSILLEGDIWLSLAATQYYDARGGKVPSDDFINSIKRTVDLTGFPQVKEITSDDLDQVGKWLEAKPISSKYYFIVARHSGKCLDVQDASTKNAANVFQYEIHGGLHQQWMVLQLPDGDYIFVARHSGKVLDVQDYSKENCGNIFQYQLHGDDNQKWEIRPAGNGYYFIISKVSGKALDVQDASTENAANVFQYELWKGDNQQWKFVPVAE